MNTDISVVTPIPLHDYSKMVAEQVVMPPQKRSRGNCDRKGRGAERNCGEWDRNCPEDRDHDSHLDNDEAKKNENNFKCSVERSRVTCPSRICGNFYRTLVEMQKPSSTTMVWMTCVWRKDKRKAEQDAERLSCAWRKGGFLEVIKVKGEIEAAIEEVVDLEM